jgi:predicted ATP-grasp superfamily ATP-dependent carboligase
VQCGAVFAPLRADHARHSRYLMETRVVSVDANDDELLSSIRSVASRLGSAPCVIIPTTDRYSQFLARNQEVLARQYHVCNPERSICDAFLDKWHTAELCRSNGILIPQTACPQSGLELARVANDFPYPVIVKPRHTFGTGFPAKTPSSRRNGSASFPGGK